MDRGPKNIAPTPDRFQRISIHTDIPRPSKAPRRIRVSRRVKLCVSREGPPEAVLKEAWSSTALRGTASRQCLGKGLSRQLPRNPAK